MVIVLITLPFFGSEDAILGLSTIERLATLAASRVVLLVIRVTAGGRVRKRMSAAPAPAQRKQRFLLSRVRVRAGACAEAAVSIVTSLTAGPETTAGSHALDGLAVTDRVVIERIQARVGRSSLSGSCRQHLVDADPAARLKVFARGQAQDGASTILFARASKDDEKGMRCG